MSVSGLPARIARRIADAGFVAAVAMIAAAGLLALRIVGLEQVFNPRSLSAIATVVVGTGVATFAWRLAAPWLPAIARPARTLLSFAILVVAIAGISAFLFSVVDFDLAEVEVVNHGSFLKRLVHHLASGYLMLLAGWTLMFPWPLPVIAAGVALWPLPKRSVLSPPALPDEGEETRPERVALALRQER